MSQQSAASTENDILELVAALKEKRSRAKQRVIIQEADRLKSQWSRNFRNLVQQHRDNCTSTTQDFITRFKNYETTHQTLITEQDDVIRNIQNVIETEIEYLSKLFRDEKLIASNVSAALREVMTAEHELRQNALFRDYTDAMIEKEGDVQMQFASE